VDERPDARIRTGDPFITRDIQTENAKTREDTRGRGSLQRNKIRRGNCVLCCRPKSGLMYPFATPPADWLEALSHAEGGKGKAGVMLPSRGGEASPAGPAAMHAGRRFEEWLGLR
jgi:hypothetical protein